MKIKGGKRNKQKKRATIHCLTRKQPCLKESKICMKSDSCEILSSIPFAILTLPT